MNINEHRIQNFVIKNKRTERLQREQSFDAENSVSGECVRVTEHVCTSVRMSGCSENLALLVVHTPETVTLLTPPGSLTKIHLLFSTR